MALHGWTCCCNAAIAGVVAVVVADAVAAVTKM